MEIVTELTKIPNLSLALGFFDGVHLGHQAVISCAVDLSHTFDCPSAVLTFKAHPACYLNNLPHKNLSSKQDKYDLIEKLGVDYVIELDFESICKYSPAQYLSDIIYEYYSPKAISTGFNHHFGAGRTGGVTFLSNRQEKYNYVYAATPPQSIFGEVISSSTIRYYIKTGAFTLANSMLGRSFSVSGTVVEGHKVGQTIGYPTANIIYPDDIVEPQYGVYEVNIELDDGKVYKGIANFGVSPTVSMDGKPSLETHIFNFNGDLYGKNIRIYFLRMIREEVKFDNINDLKAQIDLDIQTL